MAATLWTWNAWVAIGTLALAFATAWLGTVSRRAATEAKRVSNLTEREVGILERQAEVAAASLLAQIRPALVDVSVSTQGSLEQVDYVNGPSNAIPWTEIDVDESMKHLHVSLPLVNVGTGVAFITSVSLLADDPSLKLSGRVSRAVVPPGDYTRARFSIAKLSEEGPSLRVQTRLLGHDGSGIKRFSAEVTYTNVQGSEPTRSVVDVARNAADDRWDVLNVRLFSGDEEKPFVATAIVQ